MREVIAVRYGTLASTKSQLFYRYGTFGEPDARQALDFYFWLVRDGDDVVLIDTGFDPGAARRRGRTCLVSPLEALGRLQIEPRSVGQVVLTHLHYDHTGNVHAFTEADVLVPARELEFWTSARARRHHFAEHAEVGDIESIAARARPFNGDGDLRPGIKAVTVGGHSPGQQVIVVDAAGGLVVLTSDAVHLYEELDLERPFSVLASLDEMYAGYETVRRLASAPGAKVVAGHDPDVMRRFSSLPGAEGLAVRVG